MVTEAADTSPLADRALRELAEKTARGVRLLAPLVHSPSSEDDPAPVTVAGSLATTTAFTARLAAALAEHPARRIEIVPAVLDPLRGAALIAYQNVGAPVSEGLISLLKSGR